MKPLPIFLLAFLAPLHAQDFAIDWSTIGGGGGVASGGAFVVEGTVGQADSGNLGGGTFAVEGGYWGVVTVVPTEGAPALHVSRDPVSGVITIFWRLPAGWFLQTSSTLGQGTNPWKEVPTEEIQSDATHRFLVISNPVGARFYRLAKP